MGHICPGSINIKQPKPEEITCTCCKKDIEIWSDEAKTTCPGCGRKVFRDGGLMSCLDWCSYAKDCVGEDAYARYLDNKGEADRHSGRSADTTKNEVAK